MIDAGCCIANLLKTCHPLSVRKKSGKVTSAMWIQSVHYALPHQPSGCGRPGIRPKMRDDLFASGVTQRATLRQYRL